MKVTKQEVELLERDDITVGQSDLIENKINRRFSEIVHKIAKIGRSGWFDYDNCSYDSDKSGGYFDPYEYKDEIGVGGEYVNLPAPYDETNSFPTRWLWEDFEDEFNREVAAAAKRIEEKGRKAAQKRQELKADKARMKKVITSKLTKEELKYIKFK